jgi:hypothetical protein
MLARSRGHWPHSRLYGNWPETAFAEPSNDADTNDADNIEGPISHNPTSRDTESAFAGIVMVFYPVRKREEFQC